MHHLSVKVHSRQVKRTHTKPNAHQPFSTARSTHLEHRSRPRQEMRVGRRWCSTNLVMEREKHISEKPSTKVVENPDEIRQRKNEKDAVTNAVRKYIDMQETLKDLGKSAAVKPVQKQLLRLWNELTADVEKEQNDIRSPDGRRWMEDRVKYGTFLLTLDPKVLAVIALHTALGKVLRQDEAKSTTLIMEIGKAVQAEAGINMLKLNGKTYFRYLEKSGVLRSVHTVNRHARWCLNNGEWTSDICAYIGSTLLSKMLTTDPDMNEDKKPLIHFYKTVAGRKVGHVKGAPWLLEALFRDDDVIRDIVTPRFMPMLVKPVNWSAYDKGGYLEETSKNYVMRAKLSRAHLDLLKDVELKAKKDAAKPLTKVYEALNVLSETPWKLNNKVYPVVLQAWEAGGGIGELPPRHDMPYPPMPEEAATNWDVKKEYLRNYRKADKYNKEVHGLRCDMQLKLKVAEDFAKEPKFYFPHNMDFRGRAYPIPPHLNHIGADLCRGLLMFYEGKPLGARGLRWLKIHLANVYGKDKITFDARVQFVDSQLENIFDSVDNPLGGRRWWLSADKPWECLAACFELVDALRSGDPESFESRLPVHQDGTCNGLQHYAALGGDRLGAEAVNLLPGEAPRVQHPPFYYFISRIARFDFREVANLKQDVYTGVLQLVKKRIEQDANMGDELARTLLGKIDRKIVKQTVMTSVYGVTRIGARRQISNAMKGRNICREEDEYNAAVYITKQLFLALEEMFLGARGIMKWLGDCAKSIAAHSKPVTWITPLGLPIVQPYRVESGKHYIKTVVQTICLEPYSDNLPVSSLRQRSAFPPNYIHSIDSTHMLMTAIEMKKAGLAYASVHDSYWTHAATVDGMNQILRKTFAELHTEPLLEQLLEYFHKRYPEVRFPSLPERGKLDLKTELPKSPYFFN